MVLQTGIIKSDKNNIPQISYTDRIILLGNRYMDI